MMQLQRRNKAGYTLVEVLIVVSIMGILSSIGVVSFRQAIANARVKDAALNTAAFLERVGNLSKQRSDVICLMIDASDSQTLLALKSKGSDCTGDNKYDTEVLDRLKVDAPVKFVTTGTCNFVGVDMTGVNAAFTPHIGFSSVPEGAVCVQYGSELVFGSARKLSTSNSVKAFWKIGDGSSSWDEL